MMKGLVASLALCVPALIPATAAFGENSTGDLHRDAYRAAAVALEQSTSGALVRWVRNRVVVTGAELTEASWVEIRGRNNSIRSSDISVDLPQRLVASVALPRLFEGPAHIAVGFSNGSIYVFPDSFAVIDPAVEPVLAPIDESGNRIPLNLPSTDRLLSALSPRDIHCANPYIPYVNWVDTTSVAPPLPVCNGWPREFRSTQGLIYYFQNPHTGQTIGQNCPVRLKLLAMDQSGFHCHSDSARPVGTYSPAVGNTGPSGEEFRVMHEWPRSASLLKGYFWSTQSGCPSFNDSTTVDFYYIIAGAVVLGTDLVELLPGTGYTLKPPEAAHPDAYWGLDVMNQALQRVAAQYADSLPGSTLGFNDMSLPYGGTFDLILNWNPQHCGHQVGNEVDFRCKLLNSAQQRVAREFLEINDFQIRPEAVGGSREHWHLKYYGPGTYRGPGHTLSRP